MIEVKMIPIGEGACLGLKADLGNAPLVLIAGSKGFVMCGYLNMETAEILGDAACLVKGVKRLEDMLDKEIISVTKKAKEMGIYEGMRVKEALSRLL